MKKFTALLLALAMVFSLCACGDSSSDIVGKYIATSCACDGEEYSCEGEYVLLNSDGTGSVMFMDSEYSITWKLKGDAFSFVDSEGDTFEGTFAGGKLTGVYAGMDYVYDIRGGASGKSKTSVSEAEGEKTEETASEPEPAASSSGFTPVSFDFGDYAVEVVGAEQFTDYDGKDAIRIYYDFTNNSNEFAEAWWALNFTATQEKLELEQTYSNYDDEAEEDGNDSKYIYPGLTIRCIVEYCFNPELGPVILSIDDDYDYSHNFNVEFDTGNLPGVVKTAKEMQKISNPTYTQGWDTSGSCEDYDISISGEYDLINDTFGNSAIRVYFNFTNKYEDVRSPWAASYIYAFQDGVALETTWVSNESDSDEAYGDEVETNASVYCSEVWELVSDSPVEIVIADSWNEVYAGTVFTVK